jgi:hypothetical protein
MRLMATRAIQEAFDLPIDFGQDFHRDLLVGQGRDDAHQLPFIEIPAASR